MSGELDFQAGLDIEQLRRDAARVRQEFASLSNKAQSEGARIDSTFRTIGAGIASYIGVQQLFSFTKAIVNTRAEFQKFAIVLENTLGNKADADNALKMVQDFAAKTPFSVKELTDSFIRLTNQGFQPSREEMTKLGDLASSTGKDFIQLTEAIIDAQTGEFERLKEFGIKARKEGEKITFTFKGQAVEIDNTSESIRNYLLSLGEMEGVMGANEKIAQGLAGKISNLGDAWDQFLNQLGSSTEGITSGALDWMSNQISGLTESTKDLSDEQADYSEKVQGLTRIMSKFNLVGLIFGDRLAELKYGFASLIPGVDKAIDKVREFFGIAEKSSTQKWVDQARIDLDRLKKENEKKLADLNKPKPEMTDKEREKLEKEREKRQKEYQKHLDDYEGFLKNQKDLYKNYKEDTEGLNDERLKIAKNEYKSLVAQGETYLDFLQKLFIKEKDSNKKTIIKQEIETILSENVIKEQRKEQEEFDKKQETLKVEKEKLESLAKEFENFQQKKLRIAQEYDSKIADLEKNNLDGQYNENINQARKQKDQALLEIDKEIANREISFTIWSEKLTNLGLENLFSALQTANLALESSDISETEKAVLRAKIAALTERIAYEEEKNKQSSIDPNEKWKETVGIMQEVNQTVGDVISQFDGLDQMTQDALNSAQNIAGGIISMIIGIQNLAITGEKALKKVERASVILTIIGTAVAVISAITNLFNKRREREEAEQRALEEATKRKIQLQKVYNEMLREQALLMKEASSIFGEDSIAKASQSMKVFADLMKEYQELYSKKIYARGINNTSIPVSMISILKMQYPELVDASGKLNLELAKSILSTQELSDETRAYLEELVNIEEQAKKAEEALRSYLQETFGSLGQDLMNALDDALRTGADAWEVFGDAGARVLENLGKQIAYSIFFADIFKNLEDQLQSVYSSGSSEEVIANNAAAIIENFYNSIGGQMDAAEGFMQEWDDRLRSFDLWESTAREATQKGFASMSQDTANELNGRFTAIQGHTFEINNNVKLLAINSSRILDLLGGIHSNTDYCRRLEMIEGDMHAVKVGIDLLNTKGISIKS